MLGRWIDEWDEDGKEPEGSLQSIYANLFQIDLQDAGHVFSSQATENNELVCNKHIYIFLKKERQRKKNIKGKQNGGGRRGGDERG